MRHVLTTSAVLSIQVLAGHALAEEGGKDGMEKERRGREAARGVEVQVAADAPRPPAEQIKKTQMPELKDNPAKKEIKALEDLIYTMEKPGSTIWGYLDDPRGERKRDIAYVERQAAELRAKHEAVKAASPTWHRLPEYEQRVGHLLAAAAAHKAHYEGVSAAKDAAVEQAEKEAEAAWQAKRVKDDGPAHELHKASAGKVLFADKDIAAADGGVKPASSVAVDAPLFGRAYFAESGWNALHTKGVDCGARASDKAVYKYLVYVKVNGGATLELESLRVDQATFQKATSTQLSKFGSLTAGGAFANADEERGPFRWLARDAARMNEGDNAVEVEVRAWCDGSNWEGAVVARGTLTVKATKAGLEALAKRGTFKMAPSVHPAGKLTALRDKITRHFGNQGYDLLDFRTASEWQPVRHEVSGVILHRAANAVAVLRKRGTTQCEIVSLVLEEPYDGKNYGPALNFGMALHRPFVCNPK